MKEYRIREIYKILIEEGYDIALSTLYNLIENLNEERGEIRKYRIFKREKIYVSEKGLQKLKKMLVKRGGYITPRDVLEKLKEANYPISAYTLYKLIEEGVIPEDMIFVQRFGKKKRYFFSPDVIEFLLSFFKRSEIS